MYTMTPEELKLEDKELFRNVPSVRMNGESVLLATRNQIKTVQTELNGTQESINEIANREQSRYVEQTNTNKKTSEGVSNAQYTANEAIQVAKNVEVTATKYTDTEIAKLGKSTDTRFATVSDQITALTSFDDSVVAKVSNLYALVADAEEGSEIANVFNLVTSLTNTVSVLTARIDAIEANKVTVKETNDYATIDMNKQFNLVVDGKEYLVSAAAVVA
jgi:hypothetical protein